MSRPAADVVVVGAGPSGAVTAYELARSGFAVTCLEQGDWVDPPDFPANDPGWELRIQHQWSADPNVRRSAADYPVGVGGSDIAPVMFNAVGGSTILFGAQWLRMLPSDFRVRSRDGVADDWPLTYAELAPYYDEVDRLIGVAGLDGDPAFPPGLRYPLPPHPLGRAGRVAASAAASLGWHWWPGSNAIASHAYEGLAACVRRGTCEWGCPEGAKASFDRALWPRALRAGATLVTGARVRRIESRADGRATGVVWIDRAGREQRLAANAVVLCANGIGTPRLMLLSASPSHPDGLGNSSGLVGKNLMLHPSASVTGYYEQSLESWRGPNGELVHSLEFHDTRAGHDFVRGIKLNAMPMPGPLRAIDAQRPHGYDAVWGAAFAEAARSHAHGLLWDANIEDLPETVNEVGLDPLLTDGDGLPAPAVTYRLSDNTKRLLAFAVARMRDLHEAGGATRTVSRDLLSESAFHLLGTARMGDDPEASVLDRWNRAHDVPNLYVVDGSCFVTSSGVNPTSTIVALALRAADHMVATRFNQQVPA